MATNNQDDQLLPEGEDAPKLQSGDDLAALALEEAEMTALPTASSTRKKMSTADEVAVSNKVAETLTALQGVIERNADELDRLKSELKEHRESMKNYFENDAALSEAQVHLDQYSSDVKQRRSQLQNDPQIVSIQRKIADANEQKKEIEVALSNHLVNYYSMTNSTSFDTSDGDQREFVIRAAVKGRRRGKD